jgi:hypothetical protein
MAATRHEHLKHSEPKYVDVFSLGGNRLLEASWGDGSSSGAMGAIVSTTDVRLDDIGLSGSKIVSVSLGSVRNAQGSTSFVMTTRKRRSPSGF